MKVLVPPQSGSHDGITASHNRFGQYLRTRATPVNPRSTFQGLARARLGLASANWRALTDAQRAGWKDLGGQMTRTDSLGSTYTLQGNQAFVSINSANAAAGAAQVSDAPALLTPASMLTATITLTAASFSIAYTATPLATGVKLFTYVSPQGSPGKNFQSDMRLLAVSAAAAASPANVFAAYVARFGTPVVTNRIFITLVQFLGGFLGAPFYTSQVVS